MLVNGAAYQWALWESFLSHDIQWYCGDLWDALVGGSDVTKLRLVPVADLVQGLGHASIIDGISNPSWFHAFCFLFY